MRDRTATTQMAEAESVMAPPGQIQMLRVFVFLQCRKNFSSPGIDDTGIADCQPLAILRANVVSTK